jgi:hypothetical protein
MFLWIPILKFYKQITVLVTEKRKFGLLIAEEKEEKGI